MDAIITDMAILKQKSKRTTMAQVKEQDLLERLRTANDYAWVPGAGLAAIQIGVPLRFAWYKIKKKDKMCEFTLLNPRIIQATEPIMLPKEGCLSIPNKWFKTKRFNKIVYQTHNVIKQAEGFEAVIIQHELDHMNGILAPNRIYDTSEKVGRNDPCPCGSKKKYKKCCVNKEV